MIHNNYLEVLPKMPSALSTMGHQMRARQYYLRTNLSTYPGPGGLNPEKRMSWDGMLVPGIRIQNAAVAGQLQSLRRRWS
jgi:hypothetical protein